MNEVCSSSNTNSFQQTNVHGFQTQFCDILQGSDVLKHKNRPMWTRAHLAFGHIIS